MLYPSFGPTDKKKNYLHPELRCLKINDVKVYHKVFGNNNNKEARSMFF